MPTPVGWKTSEPLCGENDPQGREDTANKYARTLWQNFRAQHDGNGDHLTSAFTLYEEGEYAGNLVTNRRIALSSGLFLIKALKIKALDTHEACVVHIVNMGNGNAVRLGVAGLQTGLILSTATSGEFTISAHVAVNNMACRYYWSAWGEMDM